MIFSSAFTILEKLRPGEVGRVDRIEGCPRMVRRLHELGLRQGAVVEMIQPGPTMIIRVDGQKLWLRRCQAVKIHVNCQDRTSLSESSGLAEEDSKELAPAGLVGVDGELNGEEHDSPPKGRCWGIRLRFRWGHARAENRCQ